MTSKKSQISVEQEASLWDEKVLTLDTSQGLIRAMIFYTIKCFGIFQGKELRQLKTGGVSFGEDETGKYVALDLRNVVSAGRYIKRYDDPGNPRSVYKIFKKYCGYLANEGPLLVRPITSIKDYICYSPWPLGIAVIDQMVQTMMDELGQGQNYGNVSVSLLAVETLKNFGAGSHCIGTWVLRLFSMYIKLYQDEFRTCTPVNCEEKSGDACLMMSRVLDPPYPNDAPELLKVMERREREVKKSSSERQETFNSWMTNIMSENEENTDKIYVKEEVISCEEGTPDEASKRAGGAHIKNKQLNGKQKFLAAKRSKVKSLLSGEALPVVSGKKVLHSGKNDAHKRKSKSEVVDANIVARIKTEPMDESSSDLKIMTVSSITDSAFSVQVDEGEITNNEQETDGENLDNENGVLNHAEVSNGRKRRRREREEEDSELNSENRKFTSSPSVVFENVEDSDGGSEGEGDSDDIGRLRENASDSDENTCDLVIAGADSSDEEMDSEDQTSKGKPDCNNAHDSRKSQGSQNKKKGGAKGSNSIINPQLPLSSGVCLPQPDKKKDSIHILRNLLLQQQQGESGSDSMTVDGAGGSSSQGDELETRDDLGEDEGSDVSCSSPPVLSPQGVLPFHKDEEENPEISLEQLSEPPSKALDIVKFLDTAQLQMQSLLQSSLTDKVDLLKNKLDKNDCGTASKTLPLIAKTADVPSKSELFALKKSSSKHKNDLLQNSQSTNSLTPESSSSSAQKSASPGSDSDVRCPLLRSVLQGQTEPFQKPSSHSAPADGSSSVKSDRLSKELRHLKSKAKSQSNKKPPLQLQTQQALNRAEQRDQILGAQADHGSKLRAFLSSPQDTVAKSPSSSPISSLPNKTSNSFNKLKHHSSQSPKRGNSEMTSTSCTPSSTTSSSSSLSSSSSESHLPSLFRSVSCSEKKKQTGVYQYLSNHTEKAVYQTLQVNSDTDSHTFTMADLPWSSSPGRQPGKGNSRHSSVTSEISLGDYFPSGTVIPASSLHLLTRQGPRGMEMVLRFDYSSHGDGVEGGVVGQEEEGEGVEEEKDVSQIEQSIQEDFL